MSTPIEELTALVDALRAETFEQSITPERLGAILQRIIDVLPSVSDANSLKGWVAISSINELPTSPSPSQQALAYLLDTTLYVYVGSGGDTLEGKYRSAELKGTKGDTGGPGPDGSAGKSAYQSYFDTTQDNPKKTEAEWASSLLGGAVVVNNLESDSEVDALAAAMGKRLKELLNDTVAPTEMVSIPFDGGGRYIKADGSVASNNNWVSTQYIPVSEGDEFVYSGTPNNTSRAVAGYELVDGEYSFVKILLPASSTAFTNKLIIIPAGITHILAVTAKGTEAESSFTTHKSSALSEITDNLGDIATTTLISNAEFTTGYIDKNGNLSTSTGEHALIDVKIGDEVCLYDYNAYGIGETTIGKQLTETTFEPLVVLDRGLQDFIYTATEDMTIGVSVYRSIRMLVVRRNRTTMWDATTDGLAQMREEIAQTNEWVDHYDMMLGYMFENIAVIGDSMARGTLGGESDPNLGADDTGLSSHGASWLSCLAKRWGCKSKFHYTRSGTSCWGWLNNQGSGSGKYGLGRFLADIANGKVYNAYFIAYGHNDSPSAGVGTAEDEAAVVTFTDGQPSCADTYTFCAYYKAIINQIRANAPHAMIFCLSEYDNVIKVKSNGVYRQAVIDVADWYYSNGDKLVHHLETGGVPYSGMDLGTHYSTVGYACIAKLVDNEVNRVVYQHREDIEIKYFGSYNTDHDADSPWE